MVELKATEEFFFTQAIFFLNYFHEYGCSRFTKLRHSQGLSKNTLVLNQACTIRSRIRGPNAMESVHNLDVLPYRRWPSLFSAKGGLEATERPFLFLHILWFKMLLSIPAQ